MQIEARPNLLEESGFVHSYCIAPLIEVRTNLHDHDGQVSRRYIPYLPLCQLCTSAAIPHAMLRSTYYEGKNPILFTSMSI